MDFIIRIMEEKDIKQVQNIAKLTWHATYEGIIPFVIQDKFLGAAYSDESMIKRLKQSDLYIATSGDLILGFANFYSLKEKGEVELGAIYIHPDLQARGLGTALLNKGINKSKTTEKIFLDVEKENLPGINFYKAKGFNVLHEFDDNLYGHHTKMLRMCLQVKEVV
ncbi:MULTISPECIES: N-acetyltransferase [Paraliobacillus]|uniref:GNAT family N-acetyltransferase n=1 Tax=Paraliobacillus TaxID=200903 RepID=UPI000DD43D3D|nr:MULTISPECIES: N-acetyltransferase [Paraliobacillus]